MIDIVIGNGFLAYAMYLKIRGFSSMALEGTIGIVQGLLNPVTENSNFQVPHQCILDVACGVAGLFLH